MINLFKIKSTDGLLREYYKLSEAASIIGCTELDIIWYAASGKVQLCYNLDEDEKYKTTANINIVSSNSDFLKWVSKRKKDNQGYYYITDDTLIKFADENNRFNLDGKLVCYVKGLWALDLDYMGIVKLYEGMPDEWPEFIFPVKSDKLCHIIKASLNYDEVDNFILHDTIWITKKQISVFLETVSSEKSKEKKAKSYQSQSTTQKELHAVPRVEILMAVISLYHEDFRLRKENPTEVANLLFSRAAEFWPDEQEPPLGHDTVVQLLRKAMRRPKVNN